MTEPYFAAPLDPRVADLVRSLTARLVVIGSVARGEPYPKDVDLLYDYDSDRARQVIVAAIAKAKLEYRSVLPGNWSFPGTVYGVQVEILPLHRGASYRVCRRHAEVRTIAGLELPVARPQDA